MRALSARATFWFHCQDGRLPAAVAEVQLERIGDSSHFKREAQFAHWSPDAKLACRQFRSKALRNAVAATQVRAQVAQPDKLRRT